MEYFFARTDEILNLISSHSPLWIYGFVLVAMVVENFFPPFPGDLAVFICGVYAAGGHISWGTVYALSVLGTIISVMVIYYISRSTGRKILLSRKMRWLGIRKLDKVEHWFDRWGDRAILMSRWLTGIRALLAVMAGIGRLNAGKMAFYSLISAITFNFALLFLALRLRKDWNKIEGILATYNTIILAAVLIVASIVLIRLIRKRKQKERTNQP